MLRAVWEDAVRGGRARTHVQQRQQQQLRGVTSAERWGVLMAQPIQGALLWRGRDAGAAHTLAGVHSLAALLASEHAQQGTRLDREPVHQFLQPHVQILGVEALEQLVPLLLGCIEGSRSVATCEGGRQRAQ